MRKNVFVGFLCVGLSLGCLAGCEKTPEEAIVREKGKDSVKEYEGVEKDEVKGSLREALLAPEHYKNEASYEGGGLVIDTDADVYVPDTDAVSTYTVSAKEVDQEMIDTVTKAFFPEGKIYHRYSYDVWTKDDRRERATLLKIGRAHV